MRTFDLWSAHLQSWGCAHNFPWLPVGSLLRMQHRWWGRHGAGTYDRVLVDAPCTSERHVLQQAAAAHRQSISSRDWSVRACQEAAALQVKLLTAACKVGACQAQQGYLWFRHAWQLCIICSLCRHSLVTNVHVVVRMLSKQRIPLPVWGLPIGCCPIACQPVAGQHCC